MVFDLKNPVMSGNTEISGDTQNIGKYPKYWVIPKMFGNTRKLCPKIMFFFTANPSPLDVIVVFVRVRTRETERE